MKTLYDLEPLVEALDQTSAIAILKDGTIEPITSSTKVDTISKIADRNDIENLIIDKLFDTSAVGTKEYTLMLKLFKVVHLKTAATTKQRIQSNYNAKVVFRKLANNPTE